jgi:Fungal Zn(2)-Cys(6) binuclear cluster domain
MRWQSSNLGVDYFILSISIFMYLEYQPAKYPYLMQSTCPQSRLGYVPWHVEKFVRHCRSPPPTTSYNSHLSGGCACGVRSSASCSPGLFLLNDKDSMDSRESSVLKTERAEESEVVTPNGGKRKRAAFACKPCNARRLKCDAVECGIPCSRCRSLNREQDCELHQSRRGKYGVRALMKVNLG